MENHALDIIDMLYNMIAEAWGVPLGNDKCIVERDKALNLLDDLKATLPMELSEARRLVNARDEFVANAKQEADNIRRGAEDKATQMIDEQSVYQEAKRRSDEIVQTAETKSRELLRAANSVRSSSSLIAFSAIWRSRLSFMCSTIMRNATTAISHNSHTVSTTTFLPGLHKAIEAVNKTGTTTPSAYAPCFNFG